MYQRLVLRGVELNVQYRSVADHVVLLEDDKPPVCIFQSDANSNLAITPKAILLTKRGTLLEISSQFRDGSQASSTQYIQTKKTPEELREIFLASGLKDLHPPVRKPSIADRIKFALSMT